MSWQRRNVVAALLASGFTSACNGITSTSGPPQISARPRISGTAIEGGTLVTSGGSFRGAVESTKVQWCRNGAPIPGASATSYSPVAADRGARISVQLTASNANGTSAIAVSENAPVVTALPLRITGQSPALVVGTPFEFAPVIEGGEAPYFVEVPATNYFGLKLTPGLTLDRDTGRVTGTPLREDYAILRVTDAAGAQAQAVVGDPYAEHIARTEALIAQMEAAPDTPLRALPATPLPRGARVMEIGHHEIALSRYVAIGMSNWTYGTLTWCRLLDRRFNMDSPYMTAEPWGRNGGSIPLMIPRSGHGASNQGVEADTLRGPLLGVPAWNTPGMLHRLAYALSLEPDIVYLAIGENDIQGGRPADEIIADLDLVLRLLVWGGCHVVLRSAQPSWPNWVESQRAAREELNAWILAQRGRTGVHIADLTEAWNSPDMLHERVIPPTAGGGLYYDAMNPVGAYRSALVVLPILRELIAAGDTFSVIPSVGNLLPDYGLTGSDGTRNGAVTGAVATGWRLTRLTGTATAVGAKEPNFDSGRDRQLITVTSPGDGVAEHRFRFGQDILTFAEAGLAEGDWIQLAIPVELDDWDGWRSVVAKLDLQSADATARRQFRAHLIVSVDGPVTGTRLSTGRVKTVLLTEPAQIEPGYGLVSIRQTELLDFYIDGRATGSGTARIGSPILRKLKTDPLAAWKLA